MAANARGQMRPHNAGKTPSFVVIGLLIVTAILGFNYWNVSAKNSLLAKEVNENRERFRMASVKKLALEKRNDALMQRVNEGEMEVIKQKAVVGKRDEEVESMQRQLDAKKEEVNMHLTDKQGCQSDLESARQQVQNEQSIAAIAKKEQDECEQKLKSAQDVTCPVVNNPNQQSCTSVCDNVRVSIVRAMVRQFGLSALKTIENGGISIAGVPVNDISGPQPTQPYGQPPQDQNQQQPPFQQQQPQQPIDQQQPFQQQQPQQPIDRQQPFQQQPQPPQGNLPNLPATVPNQTGSPNLLPRESEQVDRFKSFKPVFQVTGGVPGHQGVPTPAPFNNPQNPGDVQQQPPQQQQEQQPLQQQQQQQPPQEQQQQMQQIPGPNQQPPGAIAAPNGMQGGLIGDPPIGQFNPNEVAKIQPSDKNGPAGQPGVLGAGEGVSGANNTNVATVVNNTASPTLLPPDSNKQNLAASNVTQARNNVPGPNTPANSSNTTGTQAESTKLLSQGTGGLLKSIYSKVQGLVAGNKPGLLEKLATGVESQRDTLQAPRVGEIDIKNKVMEGQIGAGAGPNIIGLPAPSDALESRRQEENLPREGFPGVKVDDTQRGPDFDRAIDKEMNGDRNVMGNEGNRDQLKMEKDPRFAVGDDNVRGDNMQWNKPMQDVIQQEQQAPMGQGGFNPEQHNKPERLVPPNI